MRDGGGDDQEKSRCGRQCSCDAAGSHERNYPIRESGDLRISEHNDVAVDGEFVARPSVFVGSFCERRIGIVVVLDSPVAVLVLELQ